MMPRAITPVDPHRLPELDAELFPRLPEALLFPSGFSDKAWKTGTLYEGFSAKVSPEGYKWFAETSFVTMLSMAAMRRVKIPFSNADYTPLMALLMAEPSTYKKSVTANVAAMVLTASGLGWLPQSAKYTPQKMIHDMSGGVPKDYSSMDELKQHRFKQRRAFAGQRGLIIGEAGQFLKSMTKESGTMAGYHPLLLEMDDCRPTYDSGTIGRGDETVENPYMSLLGCMTPSNVRSLAKEDAELYGSGFWSRVVVVCPPEGGMVDAAFEVGEVLVPFELHNAISKWHDRLGVPSVDIEQDMEENKKSGELTPIPGKFTVTADSLPENTVTFGPGVYEAWKRYRSALKTIAVTSLAFGDLKANYDRLPTRAMRVAALLASLENDGVIELCHWAKAQEIAERWRLFLHELYRQSNSRASKLKPLSELLIELLQKYQAEGKTPSVREMYQRSSLLHGIKRETIEQCLKHLQQDGLVSAPIRDPDPKKKKIMYALMPPEERGLKIVQSNVDDDDMTFDPDSEGM